MATTAPTGQQRSPIERIDVSELSLDAKNPRFADVGEGDVQEQLVELLWREFAVDEVAMSIAANGFYDYEPLLAARERNKLVVVEGNRRLAAVLLLLDPKLRRRVGATELPQLSARERRELETLPVRIQSRDEIWEYVGFKHVNGPQAWQSYSKAKYIAWVHNELNVPLDDVARRIGDRHATVRRLYRALMVIEQAREQGVYSIEDRTKKHFSFSHLYTGLDYAGVQSHLGLAQDRGFRPNPIPKAKTKALGELLTWLYGSKSRNVEPVIRSQNPDLRNLDEVLQSKDGVAALRQRLPLAISLNLAKGDERILREALIAAKQNLQEARGAVLLGYHGERDVRDISEDVLDLAEAIHEEMETSQRRGRRAARSRGATAS
jgi:hypothetical protein